MKLQVYILRQLVVALAFSVGGMMLVAMPGIAVRTAHEIPTASAAHLGQFVAISLQNLVPYVLPICFLLATVATYGRLAADKEWIAIQMAGVRPSKMLIPPIVVGVLLGGFALMLLSTALPGGKAKQRDLILAATSSALANLGPGGTSLSFSDGEVVLEALSYDETTGLMHDVFLRSGTGIGTSDYHAKSAHISLEDGVLHAQFNDLLRVDRTSDGILQGYAESLGITTALKKPESQTRPRYMTSGEMWRALKEDAILPWQVVRYTFEIHYRAALAAAFLVFALLGPATGLLARKGTQLGALAICMGYSLLHYLLQMQVAKDLGSRGKIDPILAAWSPVLVGAIGALWLCRKALRR